jgi:hypothetical protein
MDPDPDPDPDPDRQDTPIPHTFSPGAMRVVGKRPTVEARAKATALQGERAAGWHHKKYPYGMRFSGLVSGIPCSSDEEGQGEGEFSRVAP